MRKQIPDGNLVTGTSIRPSYQYETHKAIETVKHLGKTRTLVHATNYPSIELDLDWLPAAAEAYHISPDPKDYVLVSLPIVTSPVPNRNLQAFTVQELSYFDPIYGSMVYQTFNRKPTHIDHCFPAGTMIRMANGAEKPIEQISVGDMIITGNGKVAPVKRLYNNGIKAITKLIPTGTLSGVYATENHPMQVVGKGQALGKHRQVTGGRSEQHRHSEFREINYKPHFRPVSDICSGDYLCIPVHFGGSIEVDPNLAFLTGAFLAEGYYNKNEKYPQGYGVNLICGSHESEFIAKIINCAKELGHNPIHRVGVSQGADSVAIHSVELVNRLRSMCGEYAHGKHLQGELRNWGKDSIKVMLGGYMSGDGGFDVKKGSYRCRSSSKTLLMDLQQAFAFVDIPVCIGIDEPLDQVRKRNRNISELNPDKFVITPQHDSGYLRLTNFHAHQMVKYLVGKTPTCTEPEHDSGRLILQDGYIMTPVIGVERNLLHTQVYNFEVDHEDHSYVANSLIAHNCNTDPTKAKGVIVDSSMQYIPKYGIWKINIITLWDRTKDAKLVKEIVDKKRTGYSMGASVAAFICSICGKIDNMDSKSCDHMKNKGGLYGKNNVLAYQQCSGSCFFETSSVQDPADPTAWSQDTFV